MYRIKIEYEDIYVRDIIFDNGEVQKVYFTSDEEEALIYPNEEFDSVCERAAFIGKYIGNSVIVEKNDNWAIVGRY